MWFTRFASSRQQFTRETTAELFRAPKAPQATLAPSAAEARRAQACERPVRGQELISAIDRLSRDL